MCQLCLLGNTTDRFYDFSIIKDEDPDGFLAALSATDFCRGSAGVLTIWFVVGWMIF